MNSIILLNLNPPLLIISLHFSFLLFSSILFYFLLFSSFLFISLHFSSLHSSSLLCKPASIVCVACKRIYFQLCFFHSRLFLLTTSSYHPSSKYLLFEYLNVFRDIKPENLLINVRTQTLKLCDFGFARTISKTCHVLTGMPVQYNYRLLLCFASHHFLFPHLLYSHSHSHCRFIASLLARLISPPPPPFATSPVMLSLTPFPMLINILSISSLTLPHHSLSPSLKYNYTLIFSLTRTLTIILYLTCSCSYCHFTLHFILFHRLCGHSVVQSS